MGGSDRVPDHPLTTLAEFKPLVGASLGAFESWLAILFNSATRFNCARPSNYKSSSLPTARNLLRAVWINFKACNLASDCCIYPFIHLLLLSKNFFHSFLSLFIPVFGLINMQGCPSAAAAADTKEQVLVGTEADSDAMLSLFKFFRLSRFEREHVELNISK